jgi:hypothetical protein
MRTDLSDAELFAHTDGLDPQRAIVRDRALSTEVLV